MLTRGGRILPSCKRVFNCFHDGSGASQVNFSFSRLKSCTVRAPPRLDFTIGVRAFSAIVDSNTAHGTIDAANATSAAIDTVVAGVVETSAELGWMPPDMMLRLLDLLHATSGLEWWSSIILGTVAIRLMILPAVVWALRNKYRMGMMQPELLRLQIRCKRNTHEERVAYAREMQALYKRNNFHPLRSLAPLFVQGPVFMSMFFALRRLGTAFPEVVDGGALWFVDLSATDITLILPVVTGITMLASVEVGLRTQTAEASPEGEIMQGILRGLCLTMPLIASYMPCSVLVYWVSTNTFTLLQSALLSRPAVRNVLEIPQVPLDVLQETARLRAEARPQWPDGA